MGQGSNGFGIRLVDVPTELADDPRANQYVVDHAEPGERVRRAVEVSNGTDGPLSIALYAAGAEVTGDQFVFAEGREQSEVSSWTTVEPSSVSVPAGGKAQAEVTIDVPADASGGEHYGVVWAEVAATNEGDVRAVNRVGVRIYLSVGGEEVPEADFSIVELVPQRTAEGVPRVEALVDNVGGRAVDLSGELRLVNGPGGVRAGPFSATGGTTVAPGRQATVTFDLDKALLAGPWDARLMLQSGSLERRAEATITFPDEPSGTGAAVDAGEDGESSGPGAAAVVAAVLIALGVAAGLVWVVRQRRRQQQQQSEVSSEPARRQ